MSEINAVLENVTSETLMNLAFLLPAEAGGDGAAAPGGVALAQAQAAIATVGFDGPQKGFLKLAVGEQLLAPLAANMLGLDGQPPTPDQQVDALKELANVICGNVLPAVRDAQSVFNVLAPQVRQGQSWPPSDAPSAAARADLCLEEGPVRVEWYFE